MGSTLKFLTLSLLVFSCLAQGLTFKNESNTWERSEGLETTDKVETLVMGNYNVQNLFEKAFSFSDETVFNLFPLANTKIPIKPIHKIKDVSRAILESNFDILVVTEVENLNTLKLLNKNFLKNHYEAFLIEGNDPRGIDVGFLVKKSLPFYVEVKTNKDEVWNDPTLNGQREYLFCRDLPELHVHADRNSDPLFVLFGTHYKSKIDRPHDPESKIWRKAQVVRTAELMETLDKKLKNKVPLFIAGDFNGEVSHEKEFTAFKNDFQLQDAFDLATPPVPENERFTHLYFPKDEPKERSQLDGFMTDFEGSKAIKNAFPYRYKNSKGTKLPIPNTWQEAKDLLPSDHYPVVVELSLKALN